MSLICCRGRRSARMRRHATDRRDQGPALQYCPRCGAAALHPAGPKLWHCDNCGFELYLNVATAVAALVADEDGHLLIVERAEEPCKGLWDLPGGFADPGESAEEALCREVAEELGLEVVAARFLCSYPNTYEYMGVRYPTLDLGFVCEIADLNATSLASGEIAQVLFVLPEDVDVARFAFSSTREVVRRYWAESR